MKNSVFFAGSSFNNSSPTDKEDGEFCISNISSLERQKRLRFGVSQFIITLVMLGLLIAFGADRLWRLPLLFMFWAAAVGYFQARDKT
ncbi:MAG TPA: hypothetical protein VNA23_10280 [Anaerolineales bacterium]|nr:hypothetical protein [Anaerolineales bacterium]